MTVFYFTSTGNCLAVAKRIGGTLVSIPQVIGSSELSYKDDCIGLVFPIYGLGLPKMVRRFMEKVRWEAEYAFAIGTYGNTPGAAMRNLQRLAEKHGKTLHYAESLLMLDNYLPFFDIARQTEELPQKKTEEHLTRIIEEIQSRKGRTAGASLVWRMVSSFMKVSENVVLNRKLAQSYIIHPTCNRCGSCAKVCPAGNITVDDRVRFSERCEGCLGCVHLCPQNAIHMKNEKSAARWRHPEVSLKEIIDANNRSKE